MLDLKRKRVPRQRASSLPDPPVTYPDGTRFPGDVHLQTLGRLSRSADASEAPQRGSMARRAALLETLIREPDAVEVTPELVVDLGDGRRWLQANGLEPESREYGLILGDLSTYWEQSGAMRRFRDSLK